MSIAEEIHGAAFLGSAGMTNESPAEVLERMGDDVEILFDGGPLLAEPKPCGHSVLFEQVTFGRRDAEHERGEGWEARLRIRCGECGLPFAVVAGSVRAPSDGGAPGVVVDLVPMPEDGASTPEDLADGYASSVSAQAADDGGTD